MKLQLDSGEAASELKLRTAPVGLWTKWFLSSEECRYRGQATWVPATFWTGERVPTTPVFIYLSIGGLEFKSYRKSSLLIKESASG